MLMPFLIADRKIGSLTFLINDFNNSFSFNSFRFTIFPVTKKAIEEIFTNKLLSFLIWSLQSPEGILS